MAEFLIDTNVFSAVFKGNAVVKAKIENFDSAIDTIIYMELIQGAKGKLEVQKLEKYLKKFELLHFSEEVSKRAIELILTYSKSHGLLLADAVIAATCLENDLTLMTYNIRDFRFINGLKVLKP